MLSDSMSCRAVMFGMVSVVDIFRYTGSASIAREQRPIAFKFHCGLATVLVAGQFEESFVYGAVVRSFIDCIPECHEL